MVVSSWERVLEAVRRDVGLAIAWHTVVWRELERGTLRRVYVEDDCDVHNVYLLSSPSGARVVPPRPFKSSIASFAPRSTPCCDARPPLIHFKSIRIVRMPPPTEG
jgi:hypothetical protein